MSYWLAFRCWATIRDTVGWLMLYRRAISAPDLRPVMTLSAISRRLAASSFLRRPPTRPSARAAARPAEARAAVNELRRLLNSILETAGRCDCRIRLPRRIAVSGYRCRRGRVRRRLLQFNVGDRRRGDVESLWLPIYWSHWSLRLGVLRAPTLPCSWLPNRRNLADVGYVSY
jgi:hypothetical protein